VIQGRAAALPVIAAFAAVVGCTVAPDRTSPPVVPSTAEPTATATQPATPVPTSRPDVPARPFLPGSPVEQIAELPTVDPTRTSASVIRSGVRLTLTLDSTSIASGASTWATATLENLGARPLRWYPEGCGLPLWVRAELPFAWAYGQQQPGYFVFKQWVLGAPLPSHRFPIRLQVTEEPQSSRGCLSTRLASGDSVQGRYLLNATTLFHAQYGPDQATEEAWAPPPGPVDLTASLGFWWRGNEDPDEVDRPTVDVHLPFEVTGGRDMRLISPGQAVDVALGSPELRDALVTHPRIDQLTSTLLSLDEADGTWTTEVTYSDAVYFGLEHRVTVVVHAVEGTILRVEVAP
jgi:hypothetical protein